MWWQTTHSKRMKLRNRKRPKTESSDPIGDKAFWRFRQLKFSCR